MKKDKRIAFICGDFTVTLYIILGGIRADLGHFAIKVLATMILGLAGGVAGIAGKDLYQRFKIWKHKKRTNHGNHLN